MYLFFNKCICSLIKEQIEHLDISYCYEQCELGRAAVKRYLDTCESVFDAAVDFNNYYMLCVKTCPYKED